MYLELISAANDNLSIHEDKARGVYVKGLTDVYVGSEAEVYKVMKAGGASRAVSATSTFICPLHILCGQSPLGWNS